MSKYYKLDSNQPSLGYQPSALTDYAIVVKSSPGENRTHSNPKVQVLQTRPPTLTAYWGLKWKILESN